MAEDGSKRGRYVPWIVVAVVIVALAAWALVERRGRHEAERRVQRINERFETCEQRVNVLRLQHRLQVPSEAIYCDSRTLNTVSEARRASYQKFGVRNLMDFTRVMSAYRSVAETVSPMPLEADTKLLSYSLEAYWQDEAHYVCYELASLIRSEKGVGAYLKRHPEEFDRHVRPLVLRLLDSFKPSPSIAASEVLFAMGDRDPRLIKIMSTVATFYEASRITIERLNKVYDLSIPIPSQENEFQDAEKAWHLVHAIATELREEHPMRQNTVVEKWDRYCLPVEE